MRLSVSVERRPVGWTLRFTNLNFSFLVIVLNCLLIILEMNLTFIDQNNSKLINVKLDDLY